MVPGTILPLFYDLAGKFIGKKENGVTQIGTFGVRSSGKWGLLAGNLFALLAGGDVFAGNIQDGQLMNADLKNSDGVTYATFKPEDGNGPIIIQGPNPTNQSGSFWNMIVKFLPYAMNLIFDQGQLQKTDIQTSSSASTGGVTSSRTQDLYALVNGIGGNSTNSNGVDSILNLEQDLNTTSAGQIQAQRDTVKSDPFGDNFLGNILGGTVDKADDILQWIRQAQTPLSIGVGVARIIADFTAHYSVSPQDRTRPILAMGYSGGFLPLATATVNQQYNTETMIGLGAATTLLNLSDQNFQKLISYMESGLFGLAKELVQNSSAGIPDLTGTSVKRVINIWGTEDVLAKIGAAGYRATIGGISTINVEIQGATHFDYMRRSNETDPVKKDFNERVSRFVTGLILNADDKERLDAYLTKQGAVEISGIWRYIP